MDETALASALFGKPVQLCSEQFLKPDFSYLHSELKRKGVTLQLLWEEYAATDPARAYSYSRFCELYGEWRGKLKLVMRQTHRAGAKMFVDWAGPTVSILNLETGIRQEAQIFVAVLGASNYAYAEATLTQKLPDWIGAHVRAFNFFGGVSEIIVPDNTRTGVKEACYYEPDLNPTYAEMASYYGTVIIPARPYKPKDKAKVEACVLLVERWILARLRNREFHSLAELNSAIRELISYLNNRPMKRVGVSRRTQYERMEQAALRPLPLQPFEYAEWKKRRVSLDYHVEIDEHYYSVPYTLVKKEVEARITTTTIEFLYQGKRVASHVRSFIRGACTTLIEHMPKAHQKYLEWTPSKLLAWAEGIGLYTQQVVNTLLETKPHPEQGYRACIGLTHLHRSYGNARLEAACQRAIAICSPTYRSVSNILKAGLDLLPLQTEEVDLDIGEHENVRGPAYYREDSDSELIN
jgi:transposase